MENLIQFDVAQRLDNLGLLKEITTKYMMKRETRTNKIIITDFNTLEYDNDFLKSKLEITKGLTLEEAIEFCNREINGGQLIIFFDKGDWCIEYSDDKFKSMTKTIICNSLIEALEENIEYLLDNNLLK